MASSQVFVDLVIEDEVTMNAIASGAQFSLSHLDGSRPVLQVWAPVSAFIRDVIPKSPLDTGRFHGSLRHVEVYSENPY